MQQVFLILFIVMLLSACDGKGGAQACGGITGTQCPAGQVCVDDPGDDCDPKRDGADCPGTCKKAE
jgi:hypothetical protein